ncbi:MAG TPA: HAMP domain-containing sensor histidine kinase [Kribbellaceae bacterium]|nr:HAMP domain-containing sensor histidine kinase [Kribbellaceae bacterium]
MTWFSSLTSRLVLTAVLLVAVVALLIGTVTTVAMHGFLQGRIDDQVRAQLERGVPGAGLPPGDPDDAMPVGPRDYAGEGSLAADLVPDADYAEGAVIAGLSKLRLSGEVLDQLGTVQADGRPHSIELDDLGDYRVIARSVNGQLTQGSVTRQVSGVTVVGLPSESVDATIRSLVVWELVLTLLGVLAAAAAGLFLVRRQLRPLREVAATAHAVSELPLSEGEFDLSERVPAHLTDENTEVGQVGAALNTLLAHVESSLTARHRSEQQVRQFVADASHELRTPLSTIRGYAELSRRTPDDAGVLSSSLTKVETEADRMSSLVDDLLLLARLDAGRPLASEPVDLTRLLLEAVGDARVLGPDHQWRLDLPDVPLEVTGDDQRLHQVITNLLTNARRHTPAGTTVEVAARAVDDAVEISVSDNGPGVPPELAETVFERFTRADVARTRSSGGVGLGLSIVAAIVRAHGGVVHLDSEPGRTVVTVRLPAQPGEPRNSDG